MPQRLAGINVANPRDTGLVQQEVFQGAPRPGEQFAKSSHRKLARKGIKPQRCKPRALINGFPSMNAAEVTPIRKTQYSLFQFECDIHVDGMFSLIGASQKFPHVSEPEQLAIEPEVHCQQTVVQQQDHIFSLALNTPNAPAFRKPREES
jgi:hypothetical protein